jgi:hypothetical protein
VHVVKDSYELCAMGYSVYPSAHSSQPIAYARLKAGL